MLLDACYYLKYIFEHILFLRKHLLPSNLQELFDVDPEVAVVVQGMTI